jgi:endonuclease/exonuclease/phosphatase (EEP) superfamily protein YafD
VRYHAVGHRNDYVFSVLEAFMTQKGHRFRVLVVHPPHPTSPQQYVEQKQILNAISQVVLASSVPTMVAGDFNSTPFSPLMQDFRQRSMLTNASAQHVALSFADQSGSHPDELVARGTKV